MWSVMCTPEVADRHWCSSQSKYQRNTVAIYTFTLASRITSEYIHNLNVLAGIHNTGAPPNHLTWPFCWQLTTWLNQHSYVYSYRNVSRKSQGCDLCTSDIILFQREQSFFEKLYYNIFTYTSCITGCVCVICTAEDRCWCNSQNKDQRNTVACCSHRKFCRDLKN